MGISWGSIFKKVTAGAAAADAFGIPYADVIASAIHAVEGNLPNATGAEKKAAVLSMVTPILSSMKEFAGPVWAAATVQARLSQFIDSYVALVNAIVAAQAAL